MLVAYDDLQPVTGARDAAAQGLPTPSCATCLFSTPLMDPVGKYTLTCMRADDAEIGLIDPEYPNPTNAAAWDGERLDGSIFVTPDFGCVQWEDR